MSEVADEEVVAGAEREEVAAVGLEVGAIEGEADVEGDDLVDDGSGPEPDEPA